MDIFYQGQQTTTRFPRGGLENGWLVSKPVTHFGNDYLISVSRLMAARVGYWHKSRAVTKSLGNINAFTVDSGNLVCLVFFAFFAFFLMIDQHTSKKPPLGLADVMVWMGPVPSSLPALVTYTCPTHSLHLLYLPVPWIIYLLIMVMEGVNTPSSWV